MYTVAMVGVLDWSVYAYPMGHGSSNIVPCVGENVVTENAEPYTYIRTCAYVMLPFMNTHGFAHAWITGLHGLCIQIQFSCNMSGVTPVSSFLWFREFEKREICILPHDKHFETRWRSFPCVYVWLWYKICNLGWSPVNPVIRSSGQQPSDDVSPKMLRRSTV